MHMMNDLPKLKLIDFKMTHTKIPNHETVLRLSR